MTAISSATAQLLQRLPGPMAAFLGLAALGAIILFWEVLKHLGTMAHEGAHAFVNACMDGTTEFVEIKSNGAGRTKFVSGGGVAAGVAPAFLQVVTAYSLSWLLLLSGMRTVFAHGAKAGDAGILRDYTGLPKMLWAGLWLIGSILALAVGCTLLV